MKQKIHYIFLALLCSFQTQLMGQNANNVAQNSMELGAIVNLKKTLLSNNTSITALPVYQDKIRVQYTLAHFNKKIYKKYNQAAINQGQKASFSYVDSIKLKPVYATFQLVDKVQLISELNGEYNKEVRSYLQNSKDNKLIMSVSAYLESTDLNLIKQADELYLVNDKPKKYSLSLVKNGKEVTQLDLTKQVTFTYESASFCWKKERGKLILANLKSAHESCVKGTNEDIAKLNKKEDYYKF